jgi:hypothetical protein
MTDISERSEKRIKEISFLMINGKGRDLWSKKKSTRNNNRIYVFENPAIRIEILRSVPNNSDS